MKLPVDPRLPILGSQDYQRSLYSRLYTLFRDVAQAVNGHDDSISASNDRIDEVAASLEGVESSLLELESDIQDHAVLLAALPWLGKAVGEVFYLRDDIPGTAVPPTDNPLFRYIRLTASDPYNSGVLVAETVTGSAPLVTATAVISIGDSPLYNRQVNLLNTERRLLRSGNSGSLENDALQDHDHFMTSSASMAISGATIGGAGSDSFTVIGTALGEGGRTSTVRAGGGFRVANETRVKTQGATAYMRIK